MEAATLAAMAIQLILLFILIDFDEVKKCGLKYK